ncbi:MAG: VOC family protein [Saprospiraceae bacterium]|nr:VOC family protein [Saprospiraceae bacterium]
MNTHFLGLRTAVYPAKNLDATKQWYIDALGIEPYFDAPFYVGFNIGGFELGLDPDAKMSAGGGPQAYWGVQNIQAAIDHLVEIGAQIAEEAHEVGEGIKVAVLEDPFGNPLGLIENPHFKLS